MTEQRELALELLDRLLAGEKGDVPLNLALLLEKSDRLDRGDEPNAVEGDYRRLLAPDLLSYRIPRHLRQQVVERICKEVSQNPDPDLISTCGATGAELAVVTIAGVIVSPPRRLNIEEYAVALSYLAKWLPSRLEGNSKLISDSLRVRLVKTLSSFDEGQALATTKSSTVNTIHHFTEILLDILNNQDKTADNPR